MPDINPYLKIKELRIEKSSYMALYKTNTRKLSFLNSKKVLTGKDQKDIKAIEKDVNFYTGLIHTAEKAIDAVLDAFPNIKIAGYIRPEPDLTHPPK